MLRLQSSSTRRPSRRVEDEGEPSSKANQAMADFIAYLARKPLLAHAFYLHQVAISFSVFPVRKIRGL